MMTENQFTLLGETSTHQLYKDRSDKIEEKINSEDEGTILNTNKSDYLDWILDKYKIQKPVVKIEDEAIKRENRTGGRMSKKELVLCIPVAGNTELFRYKPTSFRSNEYPAKVEDGFLKIDLLIQHKSFKNAQVKIDRAQDFLQTHLENLENDIEDLNQDLETTAERSFDNRRRNIEREYDELDSLDVPVLDRDDVSETFAALEIDEHDRN